MKASEVIQSAANVCKGVLKISLQSRRSTLAPKDGANGDSLLIMGNGPSLRKVLDEYEDLLATVTAMAVNFAANVPEFSKIMPRYYVLADPHFFEGSDTDPNVKQLWNNIAASTWDMVLYVPVRYTKVARKLLGTDSRVKIESYNAVGVEGPEWFENMTFGSRLAMPRPRNVLIPAIMIGLWAGFREISIVGADHTWLQTIRVSDNNEVVNVQPHFYKDSEEEHQRVTGVYRGVHLHDVLESFRVAFKSYHHIRRYADSLGVKIFNCTPGSYIDAFERSTFEPNKE